MKYLKYISDFIIEENVYGYSNLFHEELKNKFPNGLNLYHITETKNVDSIMKNGLLTSMGDGLIHTLLGEKNVGRVSTTTKGMSLIEISLGVDDYGLMFPEEATYWTDEMDDLDGDEREDLFFKAYLDAHPDLIGGDITLLEDVPPNKLKVVEF